LSTITDKEAPLKVTGTVRLPAGKSETQHKVSRTEIRKTTLKERKNERKTRRWVHCWGWNHSVQESAKKHWNGLEMWNINS